MSPGTAFSDVLMNANVVDRYRGADGFWLDRIGIGQTTVGLAIK